MVSINYTIFIQIVNFLILIWVLNMVLYKPIRNILSQRKEKVSGLEQNIVTLGKEAQEQDTAYNTGIRDARSKGKKEKDAMMEAAAAEEKKVIDKINAQAQADLADVKNKIAKDAEQVRSVLQSQVDDFATAITQKILGRAV
jgi:F-type H+-transporting ATPase subunit b